MIAKEKLQEIVIETSCIVVALKETLITTPELEKIYFEKLNQLKAMLLDAEPSKDNLL